MSFIAPLAIVLCLVTFSILLLIGLVSVPWPMLLVLLVVGWIVTQRIIRLT